MKLFGKQKIEVTVANKTIVRVLAVSALFLLGINVFSRLSHVLELIFLAFFLSLALNPAVSWIAHKLRLKSRAIATAIAYGAVLVVLASFIGLIAPPLVKQTVTYVQDAPETIQSIKYGSSAISRFVQRYHLEDEVDGLSQNIKDRTKNIQQPLLSNAGKVGSALISIVTVFAITFMMLVEGPELASYYWRIHPEQRLVHDRKLASRMYRIVTGYVNGQLLLAVLAALVVMIALFISSSLLHVSVNILAMAGIVFLTGLIPMIGHIIGGAIVVLSCLFVSLPLAIIIGVFMLVHQQIENITLQPYIQAKYNELTPLLVFIAALLGIGFGGLLGGFVAIPAAGCLRIIVQDFLEQRGALK